MEATGGEGRTPRGSSSNSHRAKLRRVQGVRPATAMAARAPLRWRRRVGEPIGHAGVGHQFARAPNARSAPRPRWPTRREKRPGSPPRRRCRWRAPGRCLPPSSGRRAAAASPTNSARPECSAGPGRRVGIGHALRGTPVRPQDRGTPRCGVGRGGRPTSAHRGTVELRSPQDPEADVGSTVGERERPGVPRQQVGFEPHDELGRCSRGDVAEVLAEGVPVASVVAERRRRAPCAAATTCRRRRSRGWRARGRALRCRAAHRSVSGSRRRGRGPRARRRRPHGRGRRARRPARRGGRRRRTCRGRGAAGTARCGRLAHGPRRRPRASTTAPQPGRARAARGGEAPRSSTRPHSTCPVGRSPCRPAAPEPRHARA